MSFSPSPSLILFFATPIGVMLTMPIGVMLTMALFWQYWRQVRILRAATEDRDRAVAAEQAAIRTLRLAANELRTPAMTLLGYADHLTQAHPAEAGGDLAVYCAAIAGVTLQVLTLVDDLQDHAVGEPAARVLRPETLALAPMLRAVMATTDASLGPSRRHWRLAPDIAATFLLADRRALAQILARVLGNAARLSRDQDWIDIRAVCAGDSLALIIEDEGVGLPAYLDAVAIPSAHPASRGVGFGLALARVLMVAHGGTLMVESTSEVGSRVVLTFPLRCLVLGRAFA